MPAQDNSSKHIIEQFWTAIHNNDFRAAGELLHDDYILEWPQSGERIRGRANFIAVNENYPAQGPWQVIMHRLIGEGNDVASEVTVTDGAVKAQALTFSTIQNGKILHQTEYWPDPFEPAAWRIQWVERM